MGTWTASQCPHDLHLPAQLGGLDPIMPLIPAMLFSCDDSTDSKISKTNRIARSCRLAEKR
jgi:hypothetical protein